MNDSEKNMNDDFLDFVKSESIQTIDSTDRNILSYVRAELDPPQTLIFLKLFIVHAIVGFITLLFCPQFELSLTNYYGLFHFFHYNFGEKICMTICGLIFIGSGSFFSAYALKPVEIKKIRTTSILFYLVFSTASLFTFAFWGSHVFFDVALNWFYGACLGGFTIFQLNVVFRKLLLNL